MDPSAQSSPFRHRRSGSAPFFLQLGSIDPAAPPSPLEAAPLPEEPPVVSVPPTPAFPPPPLPADPPAPPRAPLLPPFAEPPDPLLPATSRPPLPDSPLEPALVSSGPSCVERPLEQARPAAALKTRITGERRRACTMRVRAMTVPVIAAQTGTDPRASSPRRADIPSS
jgi:hypothetical protein